MLFIYNTTILRLIASFLGLAGILALVGMAPIDSFIFYMILRVVLFAAFAISLFFVLEISGRLEIFVLAPLGMLLWNPFFIFEYDKATWVLLDIVAASFLFFWSATLFHIIEEENGLQEEKQTIVDKLIEELNLIKYGPGTKKEKYLYSLDVIEKSSASQNKKIDLIHQAKEIYTTSLER